MPAHQPTINDHCLFAEMGVLQAKTNLIRLKHKLPTPETPADERLRTNLQRLINDLHRAQTCLTEQISPTINSP